MALTSAANGLSSPPPQGRARPPTTLIVHDYLNQYGGAERVLEAMREMFPSAPTMTSIYDAEAMPERFRAWDIRASWLDRVPGVHARHQWALPLYPLVFRELPGPPADLILSTSSAWAKGVLTPAGSVHVAYIHAPMRFAWSFDQYCERESVPGVARKMLPDSSSNSANRTPNVDGVNL